MKRQSRTTRLTETSVLAETSWELQVQNGPEQGRVCTVAVAPCVVGRGQDCHIVLRDPENPPGLSRTHCSLHKKGPEMTVTDHSTNGTWVGNARLLRGETILLPPEAELRLGPSLRLRCAIVTTRQEAGRRIRWVTLPPHRCLSPAIFGGR